GCRGDGVRRRVQRRRRQRVDVARRAARPRRAARRATAAGVRRPATGRRAPQPRRRERGGTRPRVPRDRRARRRARPNGRLAALALLNYGVPFDPTVGRVTTGERSFGTTITDVLPVAAKLFNDWM